MTELTSGGLQIGSLTLPRWALYVGAGGLVLALVVLKNKAQASGTPGTPSSDSTGLLATELDQRLREQWDAWQQWVNDFMGKGDILQPPGTSNPPGTGCPPGETWDGSKCVSNTVFIGPPIAISPGQANPCGPGEIWDGQTCMSVVTREDTIDMRDFICPPGKTKAPLGGCVEVSVIQPAYTSPPAWQQPPEGAGCPPGMKMKNGACVAG